ncbi:MAG: DUF2442 domain-containing protein [Ardenticatenaceae bacterium]|nr:DUF2442 domain-containing protein [Ardenticatenaceae bacterium]
MNTLAAEIQTVKGINVVTSEDTLTVELADGRSLSVPIAWYPRLFHGSQTERENWEFIGDGEGIHWPDLDEDISVEGLILGRRSGESQRSLQRWLDARKGKII